MVLVLLWDKIAKNFLQICWNINFTTPIKLTTTEACGHLTALFELDNYFSFSGTAKWMQLWSCFPPLLGIMLPSCAHVRSVPCALGWTCLTNPTMPKHFHRWLACQARPLERYFVFTSSTTSVVWLKWYSLTGSRLVLWLGKDCLESEAQDQNHLLLSSPLYRL